MGAQVTRASGPFSEGATEDTMRTSGWSPTRWSNGPRESYAAHSHSYHKTLYCLRGSITFRLVDSPEDIELFPGDRLDIEPGTAHSAVVGPDGVTCIEAAAP